MKSTALSYRDSSADRPLRTVAKPKPERPDCRAWLTTKLAAGPCFLGPLPTDWMQYAGLTPDAAVEQFIAAQKALGAVGEWDEQGQRFVLLSREEYCRREVK